MLLHLNNKQKKLICCFSLGHGKKKDKLCEPFNFLSQTSVKNASRSESVDFLRVHYFPLTEFDCKGEATTVCSLYYLLQETGLTHKITFCIKKTFRLQGCQFRSISAFIFMTFLMVYLENEHRSSSFIPCKIVCYAFLSKYLWKLLIPK